MVYLLKSFQKVFTVELVYSCSNLISTNSLTPNQLSHFAASLFQFVTFFLKFHEQSNHTVVIS